MSVYRTVAITGVTVAAVVGVGTAALATTGSSTSGSPSASGSGSSSAVHTHRHRHPLHAALRRHSVHGELVTHSKKNGFVAHSAIRGTVQDVSSTSVAVKAADGYLEKFTVGKDTRVRERPAAYRRGTAGSIGDVHSGDRVLVVGKAKESSHASPTATLLVDRTAH